MSQRKKSRSSSRRRARRQAPDSPSLEPGKNARAPGLTLQSYEVGALPLVNHLLQRMQLEELLQRHLPPDDPRCEFPTSRAILVLVRNVLMSSRSGPRGSYPTCWICGPNSSPCSTMTGWGGVSHVCLWGPVRS